VKLDSEYVAWCRQHFALLAEGGVWAVPRSGLVFRREGDKLVLCEQMPHAEGMQLSVEELLAYQEEDFNLIRQHFRRAGIEVTKGGNDA